MAERSSRLDTGRKRLGNDQRWLNDEKGTLREVTLEGSYIQGEWARSEFISEPLYTAPCKSPGLKVQ